MVAALFGQPRDHKNHAPTLTRAYVARVIDRGCFKATKLFVVGKVVLIADDITDDVIKRYFLLRVLRTSLSVSLVHLVGWCQ